MYLWWQNNIFLHEAIQDIISQISLQQENTSLQILENKLVLGPMEG
jgi:hypothetical protein